MRVSGRMSNTGPRDIIKLWHKASMKLKRKLFHKLLITRSRLGGVIPLGRPRSVHKSDVECRFLSRNGQMTVKVKVNDPHFQYQLREFQDANLVILAQIHYNLSLGQAKFPRILSQNDLEDQDLWPPFSLPTESIPYGCAAVLAPPFFAILGIELIFWGYFFSSTDTKTKTTNPYRIRSFWPQIQSSANSPTQSGSMQSLKVFLFLSWINWWSGSQVVGDLKRHDALVTSL